MGYHIVCAVGDDFGDEGGVEGGEGFESWSYIGKDRQRVTCAHEGVDGGFVEGSVIFSKSVVEGVTGY